MASKKILRATPSSKRPVSGIEVEHVKRPAKSEGLVDEPLVGKKHKLEEELELVDELRIYEHKLLESSVDRPIDDMEIEGPEPDSFSRPMDPEVSFARHENNILRVAANTSYVAFLERDELIAPLRYKPDGEPVERRRVGFCCVPSTWFTKVWAELRKGDDADFLLDLLYPSSASSSSKLSFESDFVGAYRELSVDDRERLFVLWMWFVARVGQRGDEAPILTVYVDIDEFERKLTGPLELSTWYHLRVCETPGFGDLQGTAYRLGLTPDQDGQPTAVGVPLLSLELVKGRAEAELGRMPQLVLRMLHFPQAPPKRLEEEETRGPSPEFGLSLGFGLGSETHEGSPSETILERVARAPMELIGRLRAGVRFAREWIATMLRGPTPALAGPFGPFGLHGGNYELPEAPVSGTTRAYIAADPIGGGQKQPPNPMVQGTGHYQPFVGVVNVGQGNCNVLFGNDGKPVVYYDFGWSNDGSNRPAAVPDLVLDNRPLIILSHWDKDHVQLGEHLPRAFSLEWLAPQMDMSTGEVLYIVREIMINQGKLHLWTKDQGYMTFPWGFVVRAYRVGNNKKHRNNIGLIIYACVREDNSKPTLPHSALGSAACEVIDADTVVSTVVAHLNQKSAKKTVSVPNIQNNLGQMFAAFTRMRRVGVMRWTVHPVDNHNAVSMVVAGLLEHGKSAGPSDGQIVAACEAAVEAAALSSSGEVVALAAAVALEPGGLSATTCATVAKDAYGEAAKSLSQLQIDANLIANHGGISAQLRYKIAGLAVDMYTKTATTDPAERVASGDNAKLIAAARKGAECVVKSTKNLLEDLACEVAGLWPCFTADQDTVEEIARGVRVPATCVPGVIQTLDPNAPPYSQDELFIMSGGDAMMQFIPTQQLAVFPKPPLVVAMAATHHGSDMADSAHLEAEAIPWAPNSVQAYVVGSLDANDSDEIKAVSAAAMATIEDSGLSQTDYEARLDRVHKAAKAALEGFGKLGTPTRINDCFPAALFTALRYLGHTSITYQDVTTAIAAKALAPANTPAHQALAGGAHAIQGMGNPLPDPWPNGFDGDLASEAAVTAYGVILSQNYDKVKAKKKQKKLAPKLESFILSVRGAVKGLCSKTAFGHILTAASGQALTPAEEHDFAAALFYAAVVVAVGTLGTEVTELSISSRKKVPALAVACGAASVALEGKEDRAYDVIRTITVALSAFPAEVNAAKAASRLTFVPRGPGRIAYSAGYQGTDPFNQFGHPSDVAVTMYRSHGYSDGLCTHLPPFSPPCNPAMGWRSGQNPGAPLLKGGISGDTNCKGLTSFHTDPNG